MMDDDLCVLRFVREPEAEKGGTSVAEEFGLRAGTTRGERGRPGDTGGSGKNGLNAGCTASVGRKATKTPAVGVVAVLRLSTPMPHASSAAVVPAPP